MTPDEAHVAARAAVRERDAGARGDLRDERHRLVRRAGPGSPVRVSAAATQPGLLGGRDRARSGWGSAERRRCSASCRRCCWRRCPTSSRASSFASTSRSRTNPATRHFLTAPHFTSLRDHAASFEDVAALDTYSETGLDLVKDGQAQRLRVLQVTSDYFRTLRLERRCAAANSIATTRPGTRRVVLSDALWRTRFDGDPSIDRRDHSTERGTVRSGGNRAPRLRGSDRRRTWMRGCPTISRETRLRGKLLADRGRAAAKRGQLEQARAELAALSRSMEERWPAARAERHRRAAAAGGSGGERRAARCNCCSSPWDSCSWSRA